MTFGKVPGYIYEYRKGMPHVVQKKTGSPVIVPLRAEAKAIIIDKYDMHLPKISHVKFNKYIKELVRLAGIMGPVKMTHKKGNSPTSGFAALYPRQANHVGYTRTEDAIAVSCLPYN